MNELLRYSWQSAACLALFYAIYWLFLKNETHFVSNRVYLLLSLILSLTIPLWTISSPFRSILVSASSYTLSTPSTSTRFAWDLDHIILLVYLSGLVFFAVRFLSHILKLLLIVRRFGRQHRYGSHIVFHDLDTPPFSFFSHVFVNQSRLQKNDLRHIIAHERVHILQLHSLDILLIEFVTLIQWFNPFVWPYKRSIKELHEYLADQGVIAQGFNTTRYQSLLFEQQIGAKLFEFANNFKQSQIKRRITMMTRMKSGKSAQMKFFLIVPFATFLMLAFAEPRIVFDHTSGEDAVSSDPGQPSTSEETKKKASATMPDPERDKAMKELTLKEMDVKQKLTETSDPAEQEKLKQTLEKIAVKKKFLKEGGQINATASVDDIRYLQEMELKLKAKLEDTEDPQMRDELKKKLALTQKKREQMESSKGEPAFNSTKPVMDKESLLKEFQKLSDLEKKIGEKIAASTDEQEKSDWLKKLEEIQAKKKQLKKIAAKADEG